MQWSGADEEQQCGGAVGVGDDVPAGAPQLTQSSDNLEAAAGPSTVEAALLPSFGVAPWQPWAIPTRGEGLGGRHPSYGGGGAPMLIPIPGTDAAAAACGGSPALAASSGAWTVYGRELPAAREDEAREERGMPAYLAAEDRATPVGRMLPPATEVQDGGDAA